jgi:predicted RNA-binding Zn-ribbon protein involved in translation (DUF1610 family)
MVTGVLHRGEGWGYDIGVEVPRMDWRRMAKEIKSTQAVAGTMKSLRRQWEPKRDDPAAKISTCLRCGKEFVQRKRSYHKYCTTCGEQNLIDSVEQQRNHQGPLYDKAIRRAAEHYAAQLAKLESSNEA